MGHLGFPRVCSKFGARAPEESASLCILHRLCARGGRILRDRASCHVIILLNVIFTFKPMCVGRLVLSEWCLDGFVGFDERLE